MGDIREKDRDGKGVQESEDVNGKCVREDEDGEGEGEC